MTRDKLGKFFFIYFIFILVFYCQNDTMHRFIDCPSKCKKMKNGMTRTNFSLVFNLLCTSSSHFSNDEDSGSALPSLLDPELVRGWWEEIWMGKSYDDIFDKMIGAADFIGKICQYLNTFVKISRFHQIQTPSLHPEHLVTQWVIGLRVLKCSGQEDQAI